MDGYGVFFCPKATKKKYILEKKLELLPISIALNKFYNYSILSH